MTTCPAHDKVIERIGALETQSTLNKNFYLEQDKRITRHKEDNLRIFEEIRSTLSELKEAIVGTTDKKGLKTIVMEHEDFLRPQKLALNSIINWIYKGSMVTGMLAVLYFLIHK